MDSIALMLREVQFPSEEEILARLSRLDIEPRMKEYFIPVLAEELGSSNVTLIIASEAYIKSLKKCKSNIGLVLFIEGMFKQRVYLMPLFDDEELSGLMQEHYDELSKLVKDSLQKVQDEESKV